MKNAEFVEFYRNFYNLLKNTVNTFTFTFGSNPLLSYQISTVRDQKVNFFNAWMDQIKYFDVSFLFLYIGWILVELVVLLS